MCLKSILHVYSKEEFKMNKIIIIKDFEKYLKSEIDFCNLLRIIWYNHKNDDAIFKFDFKSNINMLKVFIDHANNFKDPYERWGGHNVLKRSIIVIHDDISKIYNDDNLKQRCYRCLKEEYGLNLYDSYSHKDGSIFFERTSIMFSTITTKLDVYVFLHLYDEELKFKYINANSIMPLDEQSSVLPEFIQRFNNRWYTYLEKEKEKLKKEKEKAEENKKFCHYFYDDILYSLPEEYSEYSSETSWYSEDYRWVFDPQ